MGAPLGPREHHGAPTGFCSLPPPGPAMPVIATATWAWLLVSAPCAIAQAQAIDTEPNVSQHILRLQNFLLYLIGIGYEMLYIFRRHWVIAADTSPPV